MKNKKGFIQTALLIGVAIISLVSLTIGYNIILQEKEEVSELPKEIEEESKVECIISGCNSEVCSEESMVTICVYIPEAFCFKKYSTCEVQENGRCGWTQTKELQDCLKEYR